MQSVLDEIHKWIKKWRIVINCQKNKTEIICFNSPEGKPPQSFKLGEDGINTVTSSKDLKNLLYKWISTCKYSNRNWGFNQKVLIKIIKAIFFSSLFYAGMIWMKDKNMREIEKL